MFTASVYPTKLFKRRWLILAIFCLLSFSNAGQWISFAPISNIVHQYYQVSLFAVNCLSMIYMAVYIVFIIPASWILDTYGLKVSTVLGATFNALGAWLKFCGSFSDGFHWVLVGQTFAALAQCFILGVPPRLAAAWFGERERSTATALGVFANQVGVAANFALSPFLVPDSSDKLEVERGIQHLSAVVGIFSALIGGAVLITFESSPSIPPSQSQAALADKTPMRFVQTLKLLVNNPSFNVLLLTYGIYCGVIYTLSTLLSQMLSARFSDHVVWAGLLGCTFALSGLPGTVLAGLWLDKTFAYKAGTIFLVSFSFLAMVGLTISLNLSHTIYMLFPIVSVLGFFGTSFLPLGFEYSVELTYPIPEGTAAGLLNTAAQISGIVLIVLVGEVINRYNVLAGNLILCGAMLLAVGILPLMKSDLRRHCLDVNSDVNCDVESKKPSSLSDQRIS